MGSRGLSSKRGGEQSSAKLLGKKLEEIFERYPNVIEALRIVNPNFDEYWLRYPPTERDEGSEYWKWGKNCALVVTAAALQLMGYDVEAMPRDTVWRGFDNVFEFDWKDYDNYMSPGDVDRFNYSGTDYFGSYSNPNKTSDWKMSTETNDSVASVVDNKMQQWGTHSFAAMNVSWKQGGAHVVIVYREKYRTSVFDFQTHRSYDIEDYFKKDIEKDSVGLYRLDNRKIKDKIKDGNKIFRRRKKRKGGKQ